MSSTTKDLIYNKASSVYGEAKSLNVTCIDFQKAFDQVPHFKLFYKSKQHGIGSKVGQGSVLSSVLLIIYINDVSVGLNNLNSKFTSTKICYSVFKDEDWQSLQGDFYITSA